MAKVVGVAFKEIGKIYWFNPNPFKLKKGDKVVVETVRGMELGFVEIEPREIDDNEVKHELKSVVRIANKFDIKSYEANLEKAQKNFSICQRIIEKNKLDMKLLYCEYTLDKQKIIIYYTADDRVDFRDLLKDLASEFRVRIELRQVSPRDGAKVCGGVGICGRVICCKQHLRENDFVTMKMAKDQNMSLNASKITGLCGKLMCCISYENDTYEEIRARIPLVGDVVNTPKCPGCKVISVDILRERIKTIDKEDSIEEWDAKDLVRVSKHKEVVTAADLSDDVVDDNND